MSGATPKDAQPGSATDLRVLVIDDDPALAATILRRVEALGGQCETVSDCSQVLSAVRRFAPSHIVLDLFMPGLSGMGVIQLLSDARIQTPVILSSGADRRVLEAAARSAREHGLSVTGTLAKPYTRQKLAALLSAPGRQIHKPRPKQIENQPPRLTRVRLAKAIANGEIYPAFQPKLSCKDGTVIGFEVLARWNHPVRGTITPDHFISLAERTDQIGDLTLAIAHQALDWLSAHPNGDQLTLAINISPCLIMEKSFSETFIAMCNERDIALNRITFEVTESLMLDSGIETLDLLTELRIKGITLSIDDFGTGYSSLGRLSRLPFSEVKIDKSFVMAATRSQEAKTIVAAVTALAQGLSITTVAEGVEDAETLALLQSLGCDHAQGYFFARPMPAPEATSWAPQSKE